MYVSYVYTHIDANSKSFCGIFNGISSLISFYKARWSIRVDSSELAETPSTEKNTDFLSLSSPSPAETLNLSGQITAQFTVVKEKRPKDPTENVFLTKHNPSPLSDSQGRSQKALW